MSRPVAVADEELHDRLSRVFRRSGFDGASLSELSAAAGLSRASLYHRFPGGKEQMAREVLASMRRSLDERIVAPLRSTDIEPQERVARVASALDELYSGGRQSCLLSMLSSPVFEDGPFSAEIRGAFDALIQAFTVAALDAGLEPTCAARNAERVLMLVQGSLVLARGTGDPARFRDFLSTLPGELLRPSSLLNGRCD